MNTHYTAAVLQQAIMKARPWTPTALILRISNMLPEIQPAFMDLVGVINDVESPSAYLFEAVRKIRKTLPLYLRIIFYLAEKIAPRCVADPILSFVINKMIVPFFIVVDEKAYVKTKKQHEKYGAKIILDIVGEAAHLPSDASIYMESYKHVMRTFSGGKLAVKPSSLVAASEFEKNSYEENKELLKTKLAELFTEAKETGTAVTVDAEEYFQWCHLTEEAFLETVLEERFRDMPNEVGIALQTYRKDAYASALTILDAAKKRGNHIRVRVVKGAYWGEEHTVAARLGKDFPLFEHQKETDAMFDAVVSLLMNNREYIHTSPATHNAKQIAHAIRSAKGDFTNFAFEVLIGMGESILRVLCKLGVPVLVYCPLIRIHGCIKEGMRYLLRRLDEVAKSSHVLKNV